MTPTPAPGAAPDARDAAVHVVQEALGAGRPIRGCDVDDAARAGRAVVTTPPIQRELPALLA